MLSEEYSDGAQMLKDARHVKAREHKARFAPRGVFTRLRPSSRESASWLVAPITVYSMTVIHNSVGKLAHRELAAGGPKNEAILTPSGVRIVESEASSLAPPSRLSSRLVEESPLVSLFGARGEKDTCDVRRSDD